MPQSASIGPLKTVARVPGNPSAKGGQREVPFCSGHWFQGVQNDIDVVLNLGFNSYMCIVI